MRKLKHLKHVRVAHLVLQRDAEEIEVLYRLLALEREQGDILLAHDLIKIGPRRINALAPGILALIEHIVKYLYPQVGHAHLIYIREAHTEPYVNRVKILNDRVDFVPDITLGLLY